MNDLIRFVDEQTKQKNSNVNTIEKGKTSSQLKNKEVGGNVDFLAGDTVNVHLRIKEGGKERIQQYQGTVMQRRHPNTVGETFTVRKISNGIGLERIFQIYSPNIDKIEIIRRGSVRRARLYYLRGRQGKAARIKEKIVFTHKNKG